MKKKRKMFDSISILLIVATFVLFALALVTKGITHDLFLEIAVFLVSAKLILGTQQIKKMIEELSDKLEH